MSAPATIVARDDPHLHATALFAPEPARSRLMALYAFDVELSRAAAASAEPLIARMRLQWWRDTVQGALAGADPPAHEAAGPFARLLREQELAAAPVESLIAARETELEAGPEGFDEARFAVWADGRFGALAALAAALLTDGHAASVALARRSGPVLGTAFALRHAAAMADSGAPSLLPGLTPEDRARLAAGEPRAAAAEAVRTRAQAALDRLEALRRERDRLDRRAVPAMLPLRRAGLVLSRAARLGTFREPSGSGRRAAVGLRDLDRLGPPFEGLRLALAATTGRW